MVTFCPAVKVFAVMYVATDVLDWIAVMNDAIGASDTLPKPNDPSATNCTVPSGAEFGFGSAGMGSDTVAVNVTSVSKLDGARLLTKSVEELFRGIRR